MADAPKRIPVGARVIVGGSPGTCRGDNPKVPGDYWIEFDTGTGWWSYDPSDVALDTPLNPDLQS